MFRYAIGAAALALAIVFVVPAGAQRLKAGVLTCDVSAGMGFIIGSQRNVSCVFAPEPAGPQQTYSGSISKFGLDIGATASGVMIWGVFSDTTAGPGFLAGDYFGASGEADHCRRPRRQCARRWLQSHRGAAAGLDRQLGRAQLAVGVAELRLRPGP